MNNMNEVLFRHIILTGTPYEIGRKEAELIKNYYPEEIDFILNGNELIKPVSQEAARKAEEIFNRFCPNINDEIRGFADYFGCRAEEIICYSLTYSSSGNCSQFAVLPQKTRDKNMYQGRSYEWSIEDDKRLLTLKEEGVYKHLGFSLKFLGNYDGINEKGLCVTMTNGIPCIMPEEEGLRFWMVIRILLDKCKNVREAVELIKELPISSYCTLVISDKNKEAVMVEVNNCVKTFKMIASSSEEGYLCSTNHYVLPEMQHLVKNRMKHSMDRYNSIVNTLETELVEKETLKRLLSKTMPQGLTCHYYQYGLGTLWSILFDVTNLKADICFGSPAVNQWHTFDLDTPEGMEDYKVFLPFESADPETWMQV